MKSEPFTHLLEMIAAPSPAVPAAGSASALTGATAAALGSFVCRVSVKYIKTSETRPRLLQAAEEFDQIRNQCLALMEADVFAYNRYIAGLRSGPLNAGGGSREKQKLMEVSLLICRHGLRMMQLIRQIRPLCHPPARTDATAASELAAACTRVSLAIADENISLLDGE